jgi:peptidylprolyl isomerase
MSVKAQRIIIATIGIVMLVGTLGAYFLIIFQNNNPSTPAQDQTQQATKPTPRQVDPTAYKVAGPVKDLQVTDLTVGTGDEAKSGDTVRVHYKGTIAQTGVKFDSSYDRGEPLVIKLSEVIQGWQEGVPGMKIGGKRRLVVPAAKAYGAQAAGSIPANSDLVFEIELLAVNPK